MAMLAGLRSHYKEREREDQQIVESVRSTSYDHGSFKIEMIAYFGRVRRTTAYLDHVTFKTCPDISIVGWLMFAYNSNASYRYNADTGRTYYRCGSFTQQ